MPLTMGRSKLIRDSNDRIKIFDRDEWLLKRQRERATKLLDGDKSQQTSTDKSGLEKPLITSTTTGSHPSAKSHSFNTSIDSYDKIRHYGDSKNVDNRNSKVNSSVPSVSWDRNDPISTNRVRPSTKHPVLCGIPTFLIFHFQMIILIYQIVLQ